MAELLVDTYKRYKAGTAQVITWLAEAAQKCAGVDAKLRFELSKASSTSTVSIKTERMVYIATKLANSSNTNIPPVIIRTIRDVISLRKECATFYTSIKASAERNQAHAHFIHVLERVLRELQSACKPRSGSPPPPKSSSSTICTRSVHIHNAFEALGVEDISDESTTASPPEPADSHSPSSLPRSGVNLPSTQVHTRYSVEEDDTQADFALYCFLKDISDVRSFVCNRWADLLEDKADIATVGFVANMAAGIIAPAFNRLRADCPQFHDWADVIHWVESHSGHKVSSVFDSPEVSNCEDLIKDIRAGRNQGRDMLCRAAHTLLFDVHSKHCHDHKHKRPSDLKIDKQARRSLKLVIEMQELLETYEAHTICADGLLSQLVDITNCEACNFPTLVLTIQMFLDAHRLMAFRRFKPLNDLRTFAAQTVEKIGYYSHFDVPLCAPRTTDAFMQESILRTHLFSIVEFIKRWVLDFQIGSTASNSLIRRTLVNHPTLCGMIADTIKRRMHEYSVRLCNSIGLIIPTAHLYNMAQLTGHMSKCWPSMEALLDDQGALIFFGSAPDSFERAKARFRLAMGTPLTSFATNSVAKPSSVSKTIPRAARMLEMQSKVSYAIEDLWLQEKVDHCCMTILSHAEQLIGGCQQDLARLRKPPLKYHDVSSISITEQLSILHHCLQEERDRLDRDYLSVIRVCLDFARGVFHALDAVDPFPFECPYLNVIIACLVDDVDNKHMFDIEIGALKAAIDAGRDAQLALETKYTLRTKDDTDITPIDLHNSEWPIRSSRRDPDEDRQRAREHEESTEVLRFVTVPASMFKARYSQLQRDFEHAEGHKGHAKHGRSRA